MHSRRSLLKYAALTPFVWFPLPIREKGYAQVSCQQYTWMTFLRREGLEWHDDLMGNLKMVQEAGFSHLEPLFEDLEQVNAFRRIGKALGFASPSLYLNTELHKPDTLDTALTRALDIALAASASIVVVNPMPISWVEKEDKTDEQLRFQAEKLNLLGKRLREKGKVLAYHNHDAEMRASAREFHHMMLGTEPENVKLCLDAHWIYRGSGNSEIAVFDILKLYQNRIVELHLRQSQGGVWTETFGKGDLDYERLAESLLSAGLKPHLVLEQAVEAGTPKTLSPVEAHKQSLAFIQEQFEAFLR